MADFQFACVMICPMESPNLLAFDVLAPRVEWALNTDVSMPAENNICFSHVAMVHALIALCGLT